MKSDKLISKMAKRILKGNISKRRLKRLDAKIKQQIEQEKKHAF